MGRMGTVIIVIAVVVTAFYLGEKVGSRNCAALAHPAFVPHTDFRAVATTAR